MKGDAQGEKQLQCYTPRMRKSHSGFPHGIDDVTPHEEIGCPNVNCAPRGSMKQNCAMTVGLITLPVKFLLTWDV